MDSTEQQDYPSNDDDNFDTQRATIRQSLDEIANDVGIAMRNANLRFPFSLTVPDSGQSFITMVTPVDPSDDDWSQTTDIVRRIVSHKLGGMRLCSRQLPCTMVNATMTVAEIIPNNLAFDLAS
jgi:hypothetical protein